MKRSNPTPPPKPSTVQKFVDALNEARQAEFSAAEKAILLEVIQELENLLADNQSTPPEEKGLMAGRNMLRLTAIAIRLTSFCNPDGIEMSEAMQHLLEHLKHLFTF